MTLPTPLTPADSCVRAEGSRREGYFFLGFGGTGIFPSSIRSASATNTSVISRPWSMHQCCNRRLDSMGNRRFRGSVGLAGFFSAMRQTLQAKHRNRQMSLTRRGIDIV